MKLLELAFLFIICAILFKLSAAPFYQWAPDLYDSLNYNITMWMIIIPKISLLAKLYFICEPFGLGLIVPDYLLLISGILSLIIGSVALFAQWNIKRFLAYSGISHVGFILLALYCYDYQSYFIYIFIYS